MKKWDIVAVGESLIDFVSTKGADASKLYMEGSAGGAPANMLAMAAKLGRKTAFISKVGRDTFGDYIKQSVKDSGVDVSGVVSGKELTTLAMVTLDSRGDRKFAFYRENTADVMLREHEVDYSLVENCRVFHFGTVSMVQDPAMSTTLACAQRAKAAGAKISFDPNYRPFLWEREEDAIEAIKKGMELADYVKVSEEEATLVTGKEDPEKAALHLFSKYHFELLMVTLGPKGSIGISAETRLNVPAYEVKVLDTTGAGDAFWGTVLNSRLASKQATVGEKEMERLLQYGSIAGSLATSKYGAIQAQPTMEEIEACLPK